jgi:hypothetical protein
MKENTCKMTSKHKTLIVAKHKAMKVYKFAGVENLQALLTSVLDTVSS